MCCEKNILSKMIFILLIIALVIFAIILNQGNTRNPNILVAIAENGDNTTLGITTIKFSQNEIEDGTAITHQTGSDEININETGIYQISYQLYGVQDVSGTFNFNAALSVNGQILEDTFNQSPVIRNSTENRMTITSTVILKLQAGNVLKLNGISIEDIEYQTARIDIEKIR